MRHRYVLLGRCPVLSVKAGVLLRRLPGGLRGHPNAATSWRRSWPSPGLSQTTTTTMEYSGVVGGCSWYKQSKRQGITMGRKVETSKIEDLNRLPEEAWPIEVVSLFVNPDEGGSA